MNFTHHYNRPFGKFFTIIVESKGATFAEILDYTEMEEELLKSELRGLTSERYLEQNHFSDRDEYYLVNDFYKEWINFDNGIKSQMISGVSSIFSHERADSQITRSFPECRQSNLNHKTDCITYILENAVSRTEGFFSKIESIIRLHSNVIESNSNLVLAVNKLLKATNLYYNPTSKTLQAIDGNTQQPSNRLLIEIQTNEIPDFFYRSLIDEINICYTFEAYTAVFILIRKLLENIILDLLRYKYHNSDQSLYWDGKQILGYNGLRKNLQKKKEDYKSYSDNIDKKFFGFLRKYQSQGNLNAHSIELQKINNFEDSSNQELIFYLQICFRILNTMK